MGLRREETDGQVETRQGLLKGDQGRDGPLEGNIDVGSPWRGMRIVSHTQQTIIYYLHGFTYKLC